MPIGQLESSGLPPATKKSIGPKHEVDASTQPFDQFMCYIKSSFKDPLDEHMKQMYQKNERIYRLGYEKLREYWELCRTLSVEVGNDHIKAARLKGLFYLQRFSVEEFLNYTEPTAGESVVSPLDRYLIDLPQKTRERQSRIDIDCVDLDVIDKFIELSISGKSDFDQTIQEAITTENGPQAYLVRFLLEAFGRRDPKENTIIIEQPARNGFVNMHIGRSRMESQSLGSVLIRDLRMIRANEPDWAVGNDIRGVSWLVTPELEKFMGRLFHFDQKHGTNYYYPDIQKFWSTGKIDRVDRDWVELASPEEIAAVSINNINCSPVNMREFVLRGELPKVGIITIPEKLFFQQQEQFEKSAPIPTSLGKPGVVHEAV